MADSYVLVVDVLGFSQIMLNSSAEERARRLADWQWVAERPVSQDLPRQLVSDTLFVTAAADEDGLRRIVDTAKYLLEQGLFRYLPLRGAIARGDVEWRDDALWGPAIVSAYQLGQESEWVGVVMDRSVTDIPADLYASRSVIVYPTPMKSGPIRLYTNVRWAAPAASALGGFMSGHYLTREGEILNWSWLRKVQGTSDFRLYLDLLDAAELSGEKYMANVGSHLTEAFLALALPLVKDQWRSELQRQSRMA